MKVFCDLHHEALFYSLHLLFEKRLGWELYYPIGEDWFTQGYWKIAEPYGNHPDTIRQFLNPEAIGFDQYKSINGDNYYKDGIYYCHDPINNYQRKAITLDKFKEMDIDIVISSYQPHDAPYADLIAKYKPKAKHIAQMGNSYQTTEVKNVMCSCVPYPVPEGTNAVFYHQEFDLNIFKYFPMGSTNGITSFVNCLPKPEQFELFKVNLPGFDFKAYGASCPDGTITGQDKIAQLMSKSVFGYHVKPGGDGFGHVIHNWMAVGRPVIVSGNEYKDKLAGQLLVDGETCIDIDVHNFNESVNLIKEYSYPEKHLKMCKTTHNKFTELVNFNEEEQKIRKFLDYLI